MMSHRLRLRWQQYWQPLTIRGKLFLLSAYFDIYNLFDRRYYAAHGSASTTFVQVPQQPRSFFASLEYKF